MEHLQHLLIDLRMRLAAHKQLLRDMEEYMTEAERNEVLDQISLLVKAIKGIEDKLKGGE